MEERFTPDSAIAWSTGTGLLLAIAGFAGADRFLAHRDFTAAAVDRLWGGAISLLDLASGKGITTFLLGSVLILAALLINLFRHRPLRSGRLFYVGAAQLLCTAIADFAKPPFGRLRPFQALAEGHDRWFMGPDYGSFPSGHAAFYAGLFLPLALLFPRWAAPLVAIPLLVGSQRIASHDHYASDVGASFLLAALVAGGLLKLLQPDRADRDPALRLSSKLAGELK
jgi:membrane-associated phospholipid phosphatase